MTGKLSSEIIKGKPKRKRKLGQPEVAGAAAAVLEHNEPTVDDPTAGDPFGAADEIEGDVLVPEVVEGDPFNDESAIDESAIDQLAIDSDQLLESVDSRLDSDSDQPGGITPRRDPEIVDDEPASTGLVRYDPLQTYLAEIRRYPLLSKEDEHSFAVRYRRHKDVEAARKLIVSNLRLVVIIAREYQRNSQNLLDLVQEGNIGLLEAVKQFDPFRGIRFPTYAAYWIRAYMLRHIINNLRLVKIGTTQAQRKLFFNLQKEKEKLEAEGFAPEAKLLADRLSVKESEVIEMEQRLGLPDVSVDAPMGSSDEPVTLHNLLSDPAKNIEQSVVDRQFDEALRQAVEEFKETVDEKERAIIERRLFTEDPITLQEIAADFDLSRERIRQIETRLKQKLKEFLAERLNLGQEGEVVIEEDG